MNVNDSKINELLNRVQNYRNDLSKSIEQFGNLKNLDLEELQKSFQEENNVFEIEDNRNIFIQFKMTKEDANKGCMKKIKYTRINENGKKVTNEIEIKIPKGMQKGQEIILNGEGNYIKELNKNSNLIVKIR